MTWSPLLSHLPLSHCPLLSPRPHAVLTSVDGLFSLTIIMENSRRFLKEPKGGYHVIYLGTGHPKEMGAETRGMQVCCKISTPWLRSSSDICWRVECVLWCWYVIECHSPVKNKFLFEMKSIKFTLMTGVFVWWHLCHQFWVFKSTPSLTGMRARACNPWQPGTEVEGYTETQYPKN